MEALLSSSFDLVSSYDTLHIRKGLRYLEGFLAKMCLQTPAPPVPPPTPRNGARRDSIAPPPVLVGKPKDAAFREFLRLQNGFEWNGMKRPPETNGGEWELTVDDSHYPTHSMLGTTTWQGKQYVAVCITIC